MNINIKPIEIFTVNIYTFTLNSPKGYCCYASSAAVALLCKFWSDVQCVDVQSGPSL